MLSKEQQQLILDFYFRCGPDEDIRQGRDLIAASPEAARLYTSLEETLTDLDSIKYEPCPDNLVELTVARLKLAASAQNAASQVALEGLLAGHVEKTSAGVLKAPRSFLRSFFEIAASAAAVILIAGLLFPALSNMRAYSRRAACTNNMRLTSQAMTRFASDTQPPSQSRINPGDPWWKIGDQGRESQSNTRFAWLLIKNDYLKPKVFICPGHINAAPVDLKSLPMDSLMDFPSRQNISYSFMIMCDKTASMQGKGKRIVMSDRNPVFSSIPCRPSVYDKLNEFEKVLLNDQLRFMSTPNHPDRGQNVLKCDGSVQFLRVRTYNGDDIFTVRNVDAYTGTETPADDNDIFLVP